MTLLELAVAGALLGTLLVVCLQLLQATAAQRRLADQRQLALLEVGNVLERLAARPWSDLETGEKTTVAPGKGTVPFSSNENRDSPQPVRKGTVPSSSNENRDSPQPVDLAWLGNRLPGAELKIEVTTTSDEPSAKRIAVSLRWQDRNGRYLPPVGITTWRYGRDER